VEFRCIDNDDDNFPLIEEFKGIDDDGTFPPSGEFTSTDYDDD
jgi:hypothetical protein